MLPTVLAAARPTSTSFTTTSFCETPSTSRPERRVRPVSQVVATATNEAAFGRTSGPKQTLAMNVFRAVENRVPVVRAATTGVSALIEPSGRIAARVSQDGRDVYVRGLFVSDVPLRGRRTFYTAHGDVFAHAVLAVAVAVVVVSLLRPRSRAEPAPARRAQEGFS